MKPTSVHCEDPTPRLRSSFSSISLISFSQESVLHLGSSYRNKGLESGANVRLPRRAHRVCGIPDQSGGGGRAFAAVRGSPGRSRPRCLSANRKLRLAASVSLGEVRVTGSAAAGCTRLSTCGRPANALTPHTRFSVASRLQPVGFRTVPAGELAGRIAPVPCGTQCEACVLASLCPKTGWESEFGDGFWKLKKHNKTRSGKFLKHLLALPRHPPI